MKMILLLLAITAVACKQHNATSAALDAETSGVGQGSQYFHARYLFTQAEYEDVEVAVRVEMRDGYPAVLQVKDLSPQASDNAIEQALLHKNSCSLSFIGTSTGVEGGKYTGELQQTGGKLSGCCGEMTFVPAVDTSLTFIGKKSAPLSAAEWAQLVGDDEEDDEVEEPSDASDTEPSGDSPNTEAPSTSGTDAATDDNNSGGDDTHQQDDNGGDGNTQQQDEEEDLLQKFYALDTSTILLSKTSLLPPQRGKTKKYLMQVVVGKIINHTYLPPVVHIKQVNSDGKIANECLSLLYDEQEVGTGRSNFSYRINTTAVREIWGYSDMYGEDTFFSVGVEFNQSPGQNISYTALRAGAGTNNTVPLIQGKYLERRKSEWGINDDIVAAFEDGSCNELGHNRTCTGCIMQ